MNDHLRERQSPAEAGRIPEVSRKQLRTGYGSGSGRVAGQDPHLAAGGTEPMDDDATKQPRPPGDEDCRIAGRSAHGGHHLQLRGGHTPHRSVNHPGCPHPRWFLGGCGV